MKNDEHWSTFQFPVLFTTLYFQKYGILMKYRCIICFFLAYVGPTHNPQPPNSSIINTDVAECPTRWDHVLSIMPGLLLSAVWIYIFSVAFRVKKAIYSNLVSVLCCHHIIQLLHWTPIPSHYITTISADSLIRWLLNLQINPPHPSQDSYISPLVCVLVITSTLR